MANGAVTLVLFQPAGLGAGDSTPKATTGAVLSILTVGEVTVTELPAMSETVTVWLTATPSALRVSGLVGAPAARPERVSVTVNGIVTLVLFQPAGLGAGNGAPNATTGVVLSILTVGEVTVTELPAMSDTVTVWLTAAPSALRVSGLVGAPGARPDRVSMTMNGAVTLVLFQPAGLGGGDGAPNATTGAVLSILTVGEVTVTELPAMSETVTVWLTAAPSALRVSGLVGAPRARPDRVSVMVNGAVTLVLFQPARLGAGDGAPNATTGAVLSSLTVTDLVVTRPTPLVAVHVSVAPVTGVSVVITGVAHPGDVAMPDSGSLTDQVTVTSELFQPARLGAGEVVTLTTGGVRSGSGTLMPMTNASDPTGPAGVWPGRVPEVEPAT